MIYYLYFQEEITSESISDLIEKIENIKNNKIENEINKIVKIYFSTEGGSIPDSCALIHYINEITKNKQFSIVLIPTHQISSAGFFITLFTKCDKEFIYNTFACIHLVTNNLCFRSGLQLFSYEKLDYENLLYSKERIISLLEDLKCFNKEEIDYIKEGKDVWIDSKKILDCIDNFSRKNLYSKYKNIFIGE